MWLIEELQDGRVKSIQALGLEGRVSCDFLGRREGKSYPLAPERAKAVRVSLPRPLPALELDAG